MEYFDLFDEKGNPLNKTKLRSEVHRDGDWHKAVDVWVLNKNNELLLQKRSPEKESYPNLWEVSCSGHISAGEKSLPSAVRELEEELGIKVSEKDLKLIFTAKEIHITNNGTFINREFHDVYLLERDIQISDFSIQKEEVAEIKYVGIPELKKLLKDHPENFVPHKEIYKKTFISPFTANIFQ